MRKGVAWLVVAFLGLSACGADDDDTGGRAGFGGVGGGGSGGMTGGGKMLSGDCAMANVSIGNAALHANALAALSSATCTGSTSCHQGTGKAMLSLKDKPDLRTLLVDKKSCGSPTVPLIDSRGDAAALANSWVWIKLTFPVNSSNDVVAMPSWGTPGNCEQQTVGSFGLRMPFGFGNGMTWSDANKVRDWICAGAPGP